PLPGLPPGMVSDLMSFMDNVLPFAARSRRLKAPDDGWSLPNSAGAKPCRGNRFTRMTVSQSTGRPSFVGEVSRFRMTRRSSSLLPVGRGSDVTFLPSKAGEERVAGQPSAPQA